MVTPQCKKELTPRDFRYLEELLAKEPAALSPGERAFLVARRDYLTAEGLKRYSIEGPEENTDTGDNTYEAMSVKELKGMLADREIEFDSKAKKPELIQILEADDRGELDEAEEEAAEENE